MKYPKKGILVLFGIAILGSLAMTGNQVSAEELTSKMQKLTFINEIKPSPDKQLLKSNKLCSTADSEGGVSKPNRQTIREFLGVNLRSIAVRRVTNFETHDKFLLAQEAIEDALQKSPREVYRYEPWANAVHPDFEGQLNYSSGKSGELFLTYGYICVQDETRKHWWARIGSAQDLNLKTRSGVLQFETSHGNCLVEKNGHRIFLQMSEDKIQLRELEKLLGHEITVTGELMHRPNATVGSFPPGADYFANGWRIVQPSR